VVAALLLALTSAGSALGAFPGAPPPNSPYPSGQESPRFNPPNDEEFDPCEAADPQHNPDGGSCDSYFSEQFGAFGFRPDSAKNLLGLPLQYENCDQLDAQGRDANVKKGDPECAQISGVRADSAWKFDTGDPRVVIAVFDNGIEWQSTELVDKVHLNERELPEPETGGAALRAGVDCSTYTGTGDDRNNDSAFNVLDFACDGRVSKDGGDEESDALLDASDLIAAFSGGTDEDGNGYVDDIAGWDFFDDDNDPLDSSACCQGGHGTDRMRNAAAETNNGADDAGLCPDCQVMPLRTSDDIIHDTNLIAMGTVYAADNGAGVTECSCGALVNPSFGRRAFAYADRKGLAQMMVSSDINTANHNYPTNYNEAIYVSGSLPDTAPTESCEIPGLIIGGGGTVPGCTAFVSILREAGIPIGLPGQIPTTSFFRNPNLTQYGGKNDIVLVGSTGSENTGQAAGAAGLLQSYARERFGDSAPLSGNEIRQLLTMTAEDVLPENTGTIGTADKANPGWDSHFGYGRVNLAGAMRKIQVDSIPPEVQIDAPDWFAPINVDKVGASGVAVRARVATPHFDGGVTWTLEYACGQEVTEGDFRTLASGAGEVDGEVGRIPRSVLEGLADDCDGSVKDDPGRPAGRPGQPGGSWPGNPYPEPDPERHAFQIRLTAREQADPANVGQYRKTLFAHRDDGTLSGWPKALGSDADPQSLVTGAGGEASPRMADLDADNRLDVILPTSDGELHVVGANGRPLRSWNNGRPLRTLPYPQADAHGTGGMGGEPPREPPRVPAIGDITGDGEPEVVVTALEHVYAWHRDGSTVRGFPRRVNPEFSSPCKPGIPSPCFRREDRLRTPDHHVKRGYIGSPALADLDEDGRLDVVAGALDQHLYAYGGDGKDLPGFPVRLDSESEDDGAEIVVSPAIADLDGDDDPEVVIATNENVDADSDGFDPDDLFSLFIGNATGANPTYAVHGDGKRVDGWPIKNGVLVGNLLPLVLPSHNAAVADLDAASKGDEVSISSATGSAKLVNGKGEVQRTYSNQPLPPPLSNLTDLSIQLNLADYPSIGRLTDADGLSVIKGGLSLLGAANLLAVNQNLPFNHAVQAWNPRDGTYRRGWPVATDDFQLLTEPAIARVGGQGAGRQALVGTGLYQLHAYGADGSQPAGWPKFTGGWMVATPSVGDVDDDGKLETVMYTREGWAFAWRTGVAACESDGATTNAEWWTWSHDEHGTSNYGTDSRPPSIPGVPSAQRLASGDVELTFTGSGDDGRCGDATRYEVAGSDRAIGSGARFVAAQGLSVQPVATAASRRRSAARSRARSTARSTARSRARAAAATPRAAGPAVKLTVRDGARFAHLAVRAVDDAANRSYVVQTKSIRNAVNVDTSPAAPRPERTTRRLDPGDGDDGRRLPFTGLGLAALVLIGLALLAAGLAIRRRRAHAADSSV